MCVGGGRLLVHDVDQSFPIGVSEITLMGRSEVDLGLVQRVLDFVREHAGRQTRDELLDMRLVGDLEHVVVDEQVLSEER